MTKHYILGIIVTTPKCALGRLIPERQDIEILKRDGWHNDRILVVSLDDDRLDMVTRRMVEEIAKRLYGEKGKQ